MSDPTSILKLNATSHDHAIERAIRKSKPDLTPVATLMNPDTCPVGLLGWLAWSFSVDVWDPDWPEATKREVLRRSVEIHRLKGTRGSVRRALSTLGFRTDISEWFEHGGAPHTFRIDAYGDDVFAAGFQIDARLFNTVTRLIENVKPVRSHFALRIGETFRSDSYIRAASRITDLHQAHLDPGPRPAEVRNMAMLRTGTRVHVLSDLIHVPQPRPATSKATAFVRLGTQARGISREFHDIQRRAA